MSSLVWVEIDASAPAHNYEIVTRISPFLTRKVVPSTPVTAAS